MGEDVKSFSLPKFLPAFPRKYWCSFSLGQRQPPWSGRYTRVIRRVPSFLFPGQSVRFHVAQLRRTRSLEKAWRPLYESVGRSFN